MNKKYILKPGRHQFAPGSYAIHHNGNLTDEEAEWYLEKYPHIFLLFENIAPDESVADEKLACRVSANNKPGSEESQKSEYENLPTTN